MRRELRTSLVAVVLLTVVFGLAYPLAFTGVARVLFPGHSDGSRITENGLLVGSALIGQDFKDRPRYFQSRPSQTGYAADATSFSNLGPNSRAAKREVQRNLAVYLARERPYDPGLTAAAVPVDAITQSASGSIRRYRRRTPGSRPNASRRCGTCRSHRSWVASPTTPTSDSSASSASPV